MTGRDPIERRLLLLGDARQVHLRRWARYFLDAGYRVLTFSLERCDDFPGDIRFVHVTQRLPDAARYPMAVPIVRRLIREFVPHVVNAHFAPNYGLIAAVIDRQPWVLSTWGSDVLLDPDKTPFHRWRAHYVVGRASYVTSDADVMTERLVKMGVAPDHILTFPYGVDTDAFFPAADAPEATGPRIVSNRKLDPVYNVATLIDAFSAVKESLPDASLTVAGEGGERAMLMRRAEESIGGAAIVFVGGVDHDRMPLLLRDHQIYVSTALSDTTSVSLLEAMSTGLFPIVTDLPANREWIEHGVNGLVVPPGRPRDLALAVIEAWRAPDLRAAAIARNVDLVRERAQWTHNMQPVHDLFDRLAAAAAAALTRGE